ncbi:MAG: aldose 1-epimerase family protein [Inquilinaceae bacterium]
MTTLFGQEATPDRLARRTGRLSQVAGTELVTMAEGPARGVRVLQADAGDGLTFRVAVDRGFDLVAADYRGVPIGWQSPVGVQNPALHPGALEGGLGFLRSFNGLLVTCGLDHFGGGETGPADHFGYPYRDTVYYPMHGRIGHQPAELLGHGLAWDGDRATVWCAGRVRQATVFGEVLELERRIEAEVGGAAIAITDVVTNRGFRPTPHMLLYHFNFGYPLLDEGAEFLAPVRQVAWMSHDPRGQGVGYRHQAGPDPDFVEQVYQHVPVPGSDHLVPAALINPSLRGGMAALLEFDSRQLPALLEWQCLQAGLYVLGIEPITNHVAGRAAAERRGEMIRLEAGESRRYDLRLSVLDGADAIAGLRRRVEALHTPVDDFTQPTGEWPDLGRKAG